MKGEGKMEENAKKAPQSAQKEKLTLRIGLRLTLLSLKELFGLAKRN